MLNTVFAVRRYSIGCLLWTVLLLCSRGLACFLRTSGEYLYIEAPYSRTYSHDLRRGSWYQGTKAAEKRDSMFRTKHEDDLYKNRYKFQPWVRLLHIGYVPVLWDTYWHRVKLTPLISLDTDCHLCTCDVYSYLGIQWLVRVHSHGTLADGWVQSMGLSAPSRFISTSAVFACLSDVILA